MKELEIGPASPFFIVRNVVDSAKYYVEKLGFELRVAMPEDAPFFAMVGRGSLQLMLKAVADDISPIPNHTVHEWAPWDAYVYVADPVALAGDFKQRNATLFRDMHNRDDGLTGFEICDLDGYRLFFGKPV